MAYGARRNKGSLKKSRKRRIKVSEDEELSRKKKKTKRARKPKRKASGAVTDAILRGEIKDAPIDDLRPNTFNYNEESDFIYEHLVESIRRHGLLDPLIVRTNPDDETQYELLGGEHRWMACKDIGYETVRVNDLGIVDDDTAVEIAILLNETKGRANQDSLSTIIADMKARDVDMSALPYTQAELDAMAAVHGYVNPDLPDPFSKRDKKGNDGDEEDEDAEDDEEDEEDQRTIEETLALETMDEDDEKYAVELVDRFVEASNKASRVKPWKGIFQLVEDWLNEHQ